MICSVHTTLVHPRFATTTVSPTRLVSTSFKVPSISSPPPWFDQPTTKSHRTHPSPLRHFTSSNASRHASLLLRDIWRIPAREDTVLQVLENMKESLIATLRSHMARLTSVLATHKAPLDKLHTLHETDKNTLRKKYSGMLWKRVLEGGSTVSLTHMMDLRTMAWMPTCGNAKEGGQCEGKGKGKGKGEDEDKDKDQCPNLQQDADDYKIEDVQPTLVHRALLEHTICMDHTTFGSTPMAGTVGHTQRYVDHDELKCISVELDKWFSE
ncbi:hypothetical protein V8E53_005531 [Lactarius tabidus]